MRLDDSGIARLAGRLLAEPDGVGPDGDLEPDWLPDDPFDRPPVEAAVLIALVRRDEGFTVLYTERSSALRAHSGQVAFPGGKIDAGDADAAAAAIREAEEEVAMRPADTQVLGFMPHYYTGTNYLITPVVALVEPSGPFVPNPREVSDVFEVPLIRLAQLESYGTLRLMRGGKERTSYQIDHDGHRIWGITANLTRRFRDLALAAELAG